MIRQARPQSSRGRGGSIASSNRQALVALLACIALTCAVIFAISRSGYDGAGRGEGGAGAAGGTGTTSRPRPHAGAQKASSIDESVSSRIAESIAARNRRREQDREQRLREAAAEAADVSGGRGGGGERAAAAAEEEDDDDNAARACPAARAEDDDKQQQQQQHKQQQPEFPDLGFDYPELREAKRRLRRALACSRGCPLSAVRRAYASVLGEALGGGGSGGAGGGGYSAGPEGLLARYGSASLSSSSSSFSSSCKSPAAAEREVKAFARAALSALLLQSDDARTAATATGPLPPAALEQLAPCPEADPTLPAFPRGARLLLAANLRDAGRSAPSAAVQAVRLALALPPGALAVGVHEGRSSDRTPFALAVLRLLLLPLRVPHNVTTGARADPQGADALPRIERMAALRNAALAPWLSHGAGAEEAGAGARGGGRTGEKEDAALALALGVLPGLGEEPDKEEEEKEEEKQGGGKARKRAPPPMLGPLARPDVVAFANDAFFCAEDVLRLAAHRAPIACGFDFYSAPWQVTAATQAAGRRRRGQRGVGGGGAATRRRRGSKDGDDDDDDRNELEDPAVRRDYEEDYDDEELREPKAAEGKAAGGEGGGDGAGAEAAATTAAAEQEEEEERAKLPPGRGAARHYDKWVSRDRLGGRLSNRPPYVRDEASAAALSQGLPVAAYCCWNGLALLDAAPLSGAGAGASWASGGSGGGGGGNGGGSDEAAAVAPRVVFRAGGHPHDCPASSECSLLCDDYRRFMTTSASKSGSRSRAPPYRAVLDPAVRLAYDPEQSRALFAGSGGGGGGSGGDKEGSPRTAIPGFDVAPVERALGPRRRPWAEVAEAARELARAPAAPVAPASVDCCPLRPGKNFVRFRADCAPRKWREEDEEEEEEDDQEGGGGGGGGGGKH